MASYKMRYIVQSCPKCGRKLLKVPVGSKLIGSPLVECKDCGAISYTDLRVEWYQYKPKWMVFTGPILLIMIMILVGIIMSEPAIGILAALFISPVALFLLGRDIVRIRQSKNRMSDLNYLRNLLDCKIIQRDEYETLRLKIEQL